MSVIPRKYLRTGSEYIHPLNVFQVCLCKFRAIGLWLRFSCGLARRVFNRERCATLNGNVKWTGPHVSLVMALFGESVQPLRGCLLRLRNPAFHAGLLMLNPSRGLLQRVASFLWAIHVEPLWGLLRRVAVIPTDFSLGSSL